MCCLHIDTYASRPAMSAVQMEVFMSVRMTEGAGRILDRLLYDTASAAYASPTPAHIKGSISAGPLLHIWRRTESCYKRKHGKDHDAYTVIPYYPYSPDEHQVAYG